jgi:hypothetical protein
MSIAAPVYAKDHAGSQGGGIDRRRKGDRAERTVVRALQSLKFSAVPCATLPSQVCKLAPALN